MAIAAGFDGCHTTGISPASIIAVLFVAFLDVAVLFLSYT